MEILLDTSNINIIKQWMDSGLINGVTTNPVLLKKEGNLDMEQTSKLLARIVAPNPLSVEVLSDDPIEVVQQAKSFAKWSNNVVIKIPVISEHGNMLVDTIHKLEQDGIRVNCTACMSFNQAILAAKSGATYISLLIGRINDEGGDGFQVIRDVRKWLDLWGYSSKIIAASIRNINDVQKAALSGAHCLTIPPEILSKMIDHKFSRETVRQFNEAAKDLKEYVNI